MQGQTVATKLKRLVVLPLILAVALPAVALAATVNIGLGNATLTRQVRSMNELRFDNMVQQTKDYSCGAAALATILSYYFAVETSEEQILGTILKNADQETAARIRQEGVTLLDLKRYADGLGYEGAGYKIQVQDLQALDRPAIALIDTKGYHHFIVIKGAVGDRVYLADPAQGNQVKSLDEFQEIWNGIILVFKNPGARIEQHALAVNTRSMRDKIEVLPNLFNFGFAVNPADF